MFITALETATKRLDHFKLPIVGKRTTTMGKFKGQSIAIDNFYEQGILKSKRFVIWDDNKQIIINKIRNEKGKFDRLF